MKYPRVIARHDWATVRALSVNEAEILLYGDIGENWFEEESVTAKKIAETMQALDAEYLTVRINSFGGVVADALAIYNAIRRHPAAVTVEIDGVAMSSASMIAMAGDTVRMAENAVFMVHAPWGFAMGNAEEMRRNADLLDTFSEAMSTAYARNGVTRESALALLSDGEDHYYTAAEAQAAGFVDEITSSLPIAAHHDLSRYPKLPAAAAAFTRRKERPMTTQAKSKPAAQPEPAATVADNVAGNAADNVADIQAVAQRKERERIQARNDELKAIFELPRIAANKDLQAIYQAALLDPSKSVESVRKEALAKLGEDAEPVGGLPPKIQSGMDERDKFRAGARSAILVRMGIAKDDRANPFRGKALHQLGAHALELSGVRADGMTKSEIASRVLASHSTSDFPYLMMDAANKRLQAAYEAFPATWQTWCAAGEVSDFKTVNLIRMGSFNSLATIPEGEEYTQGTVSEEREQLTPVTKGKYIQLTRQMIINDDLQGFNRMAQLLGRAAGRTVNADAYGILNANAAMSDSVELFHADHANLAGTGGAISVATLGAARAAMRKQTPPGTNATEYLNIMPRYLLVPVVKEDHARTVISSENDTDTAASRKRNPISDWGPLEVVSDPVLDGTSATAWYLAADPMDAPLVEVHFLDGNQTPYLDTEEEFLTDAVRWKVRLDYGLAANDFRGGYKNAGV